MSALLLNIMYIYFNFLYFYDTMLIFHSFAPIPILIDVLYLPHSLKIYQMIHLKRINASYLQQMVDSVII